MCKIENFFSGLFGDKTTSRQQQNNIKTMSVKIDETTPSVKIGTIYEDKILRILGGCLLCGSTIINANKLKMNQRGHDIICTQKTCPWASQVKSSRSNAFDVAGHLTLGGKRDIMVETAKNHHLNYIAIEYDLTTNNIVEAWISDRIEPRNLIPHSGSNMCKVSSGWTKISLRQKREPTAMPKGYYEVERIVKHKGDTSALRSMSFNVKWVGYGPKENTWEPYKNLKNNSVLNAYLRRI
jgi:hypothetical protein